MPISQYNVPPSPLSFKMISQWEIPFVFQHCHTCALWRHTQQPYGLTEKSISHRGLINIIHILSLSVPMRKGFYSLPNLPLSLSHLSSPDIEWAALKICWSEVTRCCLSWPGVLQVAAYGHCLLNLVWPPILVGLTGNSANGRQRRPADSNIKFLIVEMVGRHQTGLIFQQTSKD